MFFKCSVRIVFNLMIKPIRKFFIPENVLKIIIGKKENKQWVNWRAIKIINFK